MDTRTPQEREYDRLALSTREDPWQPIIEVLLDAVKPDIPLSADEERALDLILGTRDNRWLDVRTPLVTLPDDAKIVGTHDTDGTPWCAWLQAGDGQFHCGPDGGLSGDWAGFYFEELTLEQAEKLRELFNSPLLQTLIDTAKAWCKE